MACVPVTRSAAAVSAEPSLSLWHTHAGAALSLLDLLAFGLRVLWWSRAVLHSPVFVGRRLFLQLRRVEEEKQREIKAKAMEARRQALEAQIRSVLFLLLLLFVSLVFKFNEICRNLSKFPSRIDPRFFCDTLGVVSASESSSGGRRKRTRDSRERSTFWRRNRRQRRTESERCRSKRRGGWRRNEKVLVFVCLCTSLSAPCPVCFFRSPALAHRCDYM